jgi:hypothetical protein
MEQHLPEFEWFAEPPRFGFQGYLKGERTRRLYEVVLETYENEYPSVAPVVFMNPRVGSYWYNGNGIHGVDRYYQDPILCVIKAWNPALSSFANTLLAVIKYLHEWDGR